MARTTPTTNQSAHESRPAPRFFTLVPAHAGIDFIRLAPLMMGISAVVVLLCVGLLAVRGLNYGIDFAGGTLVQVRFPNQTPAGDVRDSLSQAGVESATVQDVGEQHQEFQVRVANIVEGEAEKASTEVRNALQAKFGEGSYEIVRVDTVGPKVGRDLWRDATLAVGAATLLMAIYIAVRFDFRFGIGAAVALVHDVLVALGMLSLTGTEFDLTTVAALLTVVGFSVNDTVVISDRIRENLRRRKRDPLATIINDSINETLSRTFITSGTAILVVVSLLVMGGGVIHSFALTLLVGFVAGVYSTVYVAAPLVLWLERWWQRPVAVRAR
jgi:preprotein translocase subunit SecF